MDEPEEHRRGLEAVCAQDVFYWSMFLCQVAVASLRHVFITHQHSDHTADYGNLIWLAWTASVRLSIPGDPRPSNA